MWSVQMIWSDQSEQVNGRILRKYGTHTHTNTQKPMWVIYPWKKAYTRNFAIWERWNTAHHHKIIKKITKTKKNEYKMKSEKIYYNRIENRNQSKMITRIRRSFLVHANTCTHTNTSIDFDLNAYECSLVRSIPFTLPSKW